jgi:hypothetical protein
LALEHINVPSLEREVVVLKEELNRIIQAPTGLFWLGIAVFFYAWFSSLVIQLWVIPHFFSHPGAEEGLVIWDSIGFHMQAKQKAAEISALGWSVWEMRPYGQSPVGLASAAYVLFGASPSSMLPFNALVHALSACVVLVILRKFFPAFPSFVGSLVFVLNPSSFEWVAQIHRDGIYILGNLFFVLGLVCIFNDSDVIRSKNSKYFMKLAIIFVTGVFFVWLGRPYWIQITTYMTVMFGILLGLMRAFDRSPFDGRRTVILLGVFSLLTLFQLFIVEYKTFYSVMYRPCEIQIDKIPEGLINICAPATQNQDYVYQRSEWVPWSFEKHVYQLALIRGNAMLMGGNTLIDGDYQIDSLTSFISYFPRALQIGMLSPFPSLWLGEGSTPAMTVARKIMGPVTLLYYFSLLGSVVGLYLLRRSASLWILYLNSIIGILVYSILYPNVGTLMRYRYGFYMLLLAVGVAVWCEMLMRNNKRNTSRV